MFGQMFSRLEVAPARVAQQRGQRHLLRARRVRHFVLHRAGRRVGRLPRPHAARRGIDVPAEVPLADVAGKCKADPQTQGRLWGVIHFRGSEIPADQWDGRDTTKWIMLTSRKGGVCATSGEARSSPLSDKERLHGAPVTSATGYPNLGKPGTPETRQPTKWTGNANQTVHMAAAGLAASAIDQLTSPPDPLHPCCPLALSCARRLTGKKLRLGN